MMGTGTSMALFGREAVKWLRTWPDWLWGVLAGLLLIGGGYWLHTRSVELAVQADRVARADEVKAETEKLRGRVRIVAELAVQKAQAEAITARAERDSAVARVRAVERQLTRSLARFDVAITALPMTSQLPAPVRDVIGACTAVRNDCESLRTELQNERQKTNAALTRGDSLVSAMATLDSNSTKQLTNETERRLGAEQRATEAEKRPTKKKAAAIGAGIGIVVWAVTKAVLTGGW